MKDVLEKLIKEHGQEEVIEAAEQLLTKKIEQKVPAEYVRMIQPARLEDVASMIDNSLKDITAAGKEVEIAYGERASLVKQITQVETEIKLKEAEAVMQITGDTVDIDGKPAKVKTGKQEDMYRRYVSREERIRLADLQGELKSIEIGTFKAKDRWEEAKTNADLIKARAHVQANLLKFLS